MQFLQTVFEFLDILTIRLSYPLLFLNSLQMYSVDINCKDAPTDDVKLTSIKRSSKCRLLGHVCLKRSSASHSEQVFHHQWRPGNHWQFPREQWRNGTELWVVNKTSAETQYSLQALKGRSGICTNRKTIPDLPLDCLHLLCVVSSS